MTFVLTFSAILRIHTQFTVVDSLKDHSLCSFVTIVAYTHMLQKLCRQRQKKRNTRISSKCCFLVERERETCDSQERS